MCDIFLPYNCTYGEHLWKDINKLPLDFAEAYLMLFRYSLGVIPTCFLKT